MFNFDAIDKDYNDYLDGIAIKYDFDHLMVSSNSSQFSRTYVLDFTTKLVDGAVVCNEFRLDSISDSNLELFYSFESLVDRLNSLKTNSDVYVADLSFNSSYMMIELEKLGYSYSSKRANDSYNAFAIGGTFYNIEVVNKVYTKNLNKFNIRNLEVLIRMDSKALLSHYNSDNLLQCMVDILKVKRVETSKYTAASHSLEISKKIFNGSYKHSFVNLGLDEYTFIERSYNGGVIFLDPYYENKTVNNVVSYDFKSMYPSVEATCKLPYGYGVRFFGKYKEDLKRDLYVQEIEVDAELKNGKIPCLNFSNMNNMIQSDDHNYPSSTNGLTRLTLTNLDLDILLSNYNIFYIKYIGGYKYHSKVMMKEFASYMYYKKERSSDDSERLSVKTILNSHWGKHGQKSIQKVDDYYIKDNKLINAGFIGENSKPGYVPYATFVSAYARHKMNSIFNLNEGRVIRAHTDSLHVIGELKLPHGVEIGKKLGDLFPEKNIHRVKYVRSTMLVMEYDEFDGKEIFEITGVGMTQGVKDQIKSFDDLYIGANFKAKQIATNVLGGKAMIDTEFTIRI